MKSTIWMVIMMCAIWGSTAARPPAVAGAFYPGDSGALRDQVTDLLAGPHSEAPAPSIALVVPHAGYVYSGATAAKAFATLEGRKVTRVILLGPSHHASFAGGALPSARLSSFRTPLGEVELDTEALGTLRSEALFAGPATAHDREHCLEVELPFLQVVAPEAKVVPILVGNNTDRDSARSMARNIAPLLSAETVVVVSTDFSHHGRAYGWAPFADDRALASTLLDLGRATAELVAAGDTRGFWQQVEVSGDTVCGKRPVGVLEELLGHAFAGSGRVLDVTTSGQVSGNWEQSVTYAGVSFSGQWTPWRDDSTRAAEGELDASEKQAVLELARATLETRLEHGPELARWFTGHRVTPRLEAPAGAFVTIHNTGLKAREWGRLRACMGVIAARDPLLDAVISSAVSASRDPRFPRLEASELASVRLEVSILSPTRVVDGPEAIEVGTHGVVLSKDGRSAVFLPQVATEQRWDRETMLAQLSRKAGLAKDAWRSDATFEVFTAQVFGEDE